MGRAILIIVTTVLMLLAGCIAHAASNGDGRYEIRMDYGKSMTGVGEVEAGRECYFLWRFGEGRKSVSYLGTNPKVDPTTFWPSADDDADDQYDVAMLVSLRIDPTGDDEAIVHGNINRWQREKPRSDRYTTGNENFVTTLESGDSWHFVAGTSAAGKQYELAMSIRPAESKSERKKVTKAKGIRVSFKYDMHDERISDSPIYSVSSVVDFDPDDGRTQKVDIVAPANVDGFDSCALHLSVWLDDVTSSWGSNPRRSEAQGVFNMDRTLVMNIKPSPDTTMINAERLVMDEYQHALTLRPNKRVRIELPHGLQDQSAGSISHYLSPSIVETVEIRPVVGAVER